MLKPFLRWLVRARMYSEYGMWYFPGMDMILPIVLGILTQSVINTVIIYLAVKIAASIMGYLDVHYLKRIQYQNQFMTELNPIFMEMYDDVIARRNRGFKKGPVRTVAKGVHRSRRARTNRMLRKKKR